MIAVGNRRTHHYTVFLAGAKPREAANFEPIFVEKWRADARNRKGGASARDNG
jgi:hypothetical protein